MNRRWWILIALGTGSFMAALDGSVVNTILPVMRVYFQSAIVDIEWVVTVYLLVLSGLLLTFGRLGDIYGHRTIYTWGFSIFIISSTLCGAAWSTKTLIIFRAVQAVGGAMLSSNAPAIVTGNVPQEHRGRAFGLISTMTYLGLTVGPSLGGWLAQTISWRAVFYINVPVGLTAMVLSLIIIPKDIPATENRHFDLLGAFIFLAGLTALLLGLNKGADWGWNSLPVLTLLTGSMILLVLFVYTESHTAEPMLDMTLFRSKLFSMSAFAAILNYICIYSIMFLMPFYLLQGRGFTPYTAGLLLTAQPIIMAIAAPISGALSDKLGSRGPGMVGMGGLALGLILLSRLDETAGINMMVFSLAIAGAGTGTFIAPNTNALMGAASNYRQGIASGVLASARNVGMVLGIGLAGAIFTTHLMENTSQALFRGIEMGFLAAAGVAVLGVLISAAKEK